MSARVYHGFAVEIFRQRLLSGEWGKDDCEWEWDTDTKYFFEQSAAERFFLKQESVCDADESIVMVRLWHCDIERVFGEYRYSIGDPIREMDAKYGGGVEIWDY